MSLVPDRRPFIDPDRKQTPRGTTRAPARRVSEPARSPRQGFCASGLRPQPAFAETDPAASGSGCARFPWKRGTWSAPTGEVASPRARGTRERRREKWLQERESSAPLRPAHGAPTVRHASCESQGGSGKQNHPVPPHPVPPEFATWGPHLKAHRQHVGFGVPRGPHLFLYSSRPKTGSRTDK